MEWYHRPVMTSAGNMFFAQMEHYRMAGRNRDNDRKARSKVGLAFDPIAAALRQMHDNVSSEDIPDDFLRLLDEIDLRSTRKPTE